MKPKPLIWVKSDTNNGISKTIPLIKLFITGKLNHK